MGKKISKAIWLSFDLGIGGDYPGLYKWLDNHDAIECGDSVAFFKYSIDAASEAELATTVKKDIESHMKLRAGDRLYIGAAKGFSDLRAGVCGDVRRVPDRVLARGQAF